MKRKGTKEMKHIKVQRKIGIFLACFSAVFMLFPMTASADMGPKPSIYITFENMGDETCYGTLLSKYSSLAGSSAYDGEHIQNYSNLDMDIWRAFVDYQDSDGYYFLQSADLCSDTKRLSSGYYPPDPFKILLYYPETDTFLVSGIYECYAFDSYFSVDMKGIDINSPEVQETILIAQNNYDYTGEIIALICRVIITVVLEIGIACIFGFRQKRLLLLITGINVVTQVILNVMLNVIRYNSGYGLITYIGLYIPGETVVFIIEIILCAILFNRVSETKIPAWKPIVYALVANTVTFVGTFLAF